MLEMLLAAAETPAGRPATTPRATGDGAKRWSPGRSPPRHRRSGARWFERRRCGRRDGTSALHHPAVEEAPLRDVQILANHDAEVLEPAARELPAAQARGLEADQEREQQRDPRPGAVADAEAIEPISDAGDQSKVRDQLQPHAMAQHPERREQQRPPVEAVTHELEACGVRHDLVIAARRLVNCVDRHDRSHL